MNNLMQMALVAISAIMVYEIVQSTVAYLLRDKIKQALNLFLGRPIGIDLSGYVTKNELFSLKESVVGMNHKTDTALSQVLNGVRNITRLGEETKKTSEDNKEAIEKLKLTKANTSALKKLQPPKVKTKAVTVKRTSKRPVKKRG